MRGLPRFWLLTPGFWLPGHDESGTAPTYSQHCNSRLHVPARERLQDMLEARDFPRSAALLETEEYEGLLQEFAAKFRSLRLSRPKHLTISTSLSSRAVRIMRPTSPAVRVFLN